MNDSIFRVSLDIHEHGSQAVLNAKYADTGRTLRISLRSGSTPYTISTGCYAAFKATKPDGTILFNNCTIEDNEIVYEFTEQTCSAIGRSKCEIALYGSDDKLITSPRFALLVDGTIYPDGKVESTDEFSALTDLMGTTQKFIEDATDATGKANAATVRANVATANATDATEAANQAADSATRATQFAIVATTNADKATGAANIAAATANDAAGNANLAAENANDTVADVVSIVKNTMAAGEVAGESVSMDDAVEFGFIGCRIFGKTTQNGTPTPDAPVDMVSVGDSGSITVNVSGKNEEQSMTVATPNGLPGIKVASGGNYTDANGQQWVCDEVDFARGVYVQRIHSRTFNGSEAWRVTTLSNDIKVFLLYDDAAGGSVKQQGLSSAGYVPYIIIDNGGYGITYAHAYRIRFENMNPDKNTVDELKSYLATNPIDIIVPKGNPIETPLSEEELAAYASLHTYRDNTTVSNDAGAYMELEYVIDAKKYIDSLVKAPTAWLTNVTLTASKWAGSNSLYSQVVTIPGITEYSKVDLLPSVEQLAIFFNKNVSFVTENEDGVVTVFAIGDKPLLDYTMQAQITEVEV